MATHNSFLFAIAISIILAPLALGASKPQLTNSSNRPLYFTENKGQRDSRVLYKADGAGGLTWFIERDGFTVLFTVPDAEHPSKQ